MLSIIIPAYNEQGLIHKTTDVVSKLMKQHGIDYEIVYINDGSKDLTWQEIEIEHSNNPKVRGVCFSRNFGKEGAVFAGLEYAKGDCCVVMDCDLQHPPETIIEMYHLWEQGYQVVEGVKASRGQEGLIHKMFVKVFYGIMSRSTGIDMNRASDFKLMDRQVVDMLLTLPERHLFFRALSSWVGYKSTCVEFHVQQREEGESKWSFKSLCKYAINNITSFSTAPIQFVMVIGIVMFVFSVLFGLFSLVKYFEGRSLEGFTTVILLLLLIGSAMLISLGIIGEYVAKIYEEVKRRPVYIVSHTTKDED